MAGGRLQLIVARENETESGGWDTCGHYDDDDCDTDDDDGDDDDD